jgi:Cu2+-exporting ATPase
MKNRMLGMDFTISLSLLIALIASINNLLFSNGEIYFDSICMFIFFILLGRFLEMRARHQSADIIYSLQNTNENIAIKIEKTEVKNILIDDIQIGDVLLVNPGKIIPVDAKVISGASNVIESMLTGESMPIYKVIDHNVIGGSLNIDNVMIREI